MSDDKIPAKQLTAAEAAKKVKRVSIETVDGEARKKTVAVQTDEVLSFKDYGTQVVVVTKDGQKLTGAA